MATLKLYQTEIENKRNMVVEFIQDYLNDLPAENKAEVINFQRQKIELKLKLKIRMDQSFVDKPIFNYLSVQNDANGRVFYYFIDKIVWVSSDAVGLECTLDTLNTFDRSLGEDNWEDLLSPRTHVTREHKDRFYENNDGTNTYARKIDRYAEEFHPTLYRISKEDVHSSLSEYMNKPGYDRGFWLVLGQTGENENARIVYSLYSNILGYDAEDKELYPLWNYNLPNVKPTFSNKVIPLQISTLKSSKVTSVTYCPYFPTRVDQVKFGLDEYYTYSNLELAKDYVHDDQADEDGNSGVYFYPYFADDLLENDQLVRVRVLDAKTFTKIDKEAEWSVDTESKMFNSQFHAVKFVFGESYLNILCENFDIKNYAHKTVDLQPVFSASYEIGSTMMFKFRLDDKVTYQSTDDYPLMMISTRSLERQQLTSAYLDYVKHGSKYDQANYALGLVNTGVSYAGGLAKSFATGDIVGATTSTINAATSVLSQTLAMDRKQEELQNQKASVSGMADLSMFLTTNRFLSCLTFEPRYEIKRAIADYFNRFGYATDEYKVPDFHSRCWRNFVQCDPTFYTNRLNFDAEFLDDIKRRLKDGVCFYHQVLINNKKKYDFDEIKENWEEFLVR